MKQKIVIKVNMWSENNRSKAMALVAKVDGVTSMEMIGDGKERLEVVGVDVDVVELVRCLRKKLVYADIVTVEELKDNKPEETETRIVELSLYDCTCHYGYGYYCHRHNHCR